jgi:hypothetical protein
MKNEKDKAVTFQHEMHLFTGRKQKEKAFSRP